MTGIRFRVRRTCCADAGAPERGWAASNPPQLGEGLFQRSPHPSERNGLLLGDLIVENVDGSAMKAKIAGHRLWIAPHGSHAQRCALLQRLLALSSGGCCCEGLRMPAP